MAADLEQILSQLDAFLCLFESESDHVDWDAVSQAYVKWASFLRSHPFNTWAALNEINEKHQCLMQHSLNSHEKAIQALSLFRNNQDTIQLYAMHR